MIILKQISSLENIMPKIEQNFTEITSLSVLKGESVSYQLAYKTDLCSEYKIKIDSDIKEHLMVYAIGNVPVERTVHTPEALNDDNYISHDGGLYPDILYPFEGDILKAKYFYKGLWIETDENLPIGKHKIEITVSDDKESDYKALELEVINKELPPQDLKYHQSVHADCIAQYYNMEVFSEKHWQMLEKFIRLSADYGSNMICPPIFTPPLDTEIGGERLTVQLIDITKDGDKYSFSFDKFKRYIDICHNAGIKYFYIPPFFTQWGAKYCAKFVVKENGEYKKMFGWNVESTDKTYFDFLSQLLPELIDFIRACGIADFTMFSISDEPFDDETIGIYKKLSEFLSEYIKDFKILDAFSKYEHFEKSGADIPIIPTTEMEDFEQKIGDRESFVYYCCVQDFKVSNRLIAMPLYRNRSFGYQLYKYQATGFLHWAFNFYNSGLSKRSINPFMVTDADAWFPSGDTFIAYPGEEAPLKSMRLVTFKEALQDLRALKACEEYIGYENVVKMLEDITGEITYKNCAENAQTIIKIREKIRDVLKQNILTK